MRVQYRPAPISPYIMLMNWSVVACRRVGLLTYACYSQPDSTIAIKVGGVNGLRERGK
jgi:hypothetical protein